jgi:hypothetical protein
VGLSAPNEGVRERGGFARCGGAGGCMAARTESG